jgi:hypothetical protein
MYTGQLKPTYPAVIEVFKEDKEIKILLTDNCPSFCEYLYSTFNFNGTLKVSKTTGGYFIKYSSNWSVDHLVDVLKSELNNYIEVTVLYLSKD